jgi:hypothetical protein
MSHTVAPRGTARHSGLYFLLAAGALFVGGFTQPLWLALALGFIAAGFAARRSWRDTIPGLILVALIVLALGYTVGKDMAHRDNARSAASQAGGG